jgi:hypothetical protein
MAVAWATVACQAPPCAEGQLRNQYGDCLTPDPDAKAPLPEGGEALPACERLDASDDLDLINGCVEGACVNDTYADLNAALGEVGECDEYDLGIAFCEWRGGAIHANFDDDDNDGVPDAGDEAFGLYVYDDYRGSSAGGLGIGVSLRCFLEDFIAIYDTETKEIDGDVQIVEVHFDNPSMIVDDAWLIYVDDPDSTYDGYVSRISLFGP